MKPTFSLDRAALRRRFDRAAATFDDADFVHAATREGLLGRLAPMLVDAELVVDLGAATGAAFKPLAQRFRNATIVAIDISAEMCRKSRRRRRWPRPAAAVQADAAALPFGDSSVDVVFSNLLLPWVDDVGAVAAEVARVLRKDGVFAFSTLGPDSLLTLRNAWASVDGGRHVLEFPDMHDVGDALVRAGLRDPVLDVDRLDVDYENPRKLFDDLTAVGGRNSLSDRARGLTDRGRWEQLLQTMAGVAPIRIGLELVYGHCWGGGSGSERGAVRIDAGNIPIRNRGA